MPLEFALLAVATATVAQPVDHDIAAARAARDAGRIEEAIVRLETLAHDRPDDATVLRLLGAAYAAGARYRNARQVLERAQQLAPGDRDVALARARVALWSGRPGAAARIANAVAAAEPANAELPELRRAIGAVLADARGPTLAASHGRSQVALTGGERTWTETAGAVAIPLDRDATLTGEAEHSDRVFARDTRLLGRVDARLGPRANGYFGIAVTPDADFREDWSLRTGGEAALGGRVTATLDGRYARFGAVETVAVEPGLRVALRPALDITTRAIVLGADALRVGGTARLDWQARPDLRVNFGGATYPDTEAGVTRQVRSAFAGFAWNVRTAWTLRITAEHERREGSYRRTGLTVGLAWRPRG